MGNLCGPCFKGEAESASQLVTPDTVRIVC